jgi:hypothetical protein
MEDFFYYSQVRRQGLASQVSFKVSAKVPLDAIAELMQAVGFFPSEEEILVCKSVSYCFSYF